jgi:phage gp46-like protein
MMDNTQEHSCPRYNREALAHLFRMQAQAINTIADEIENSDLDLHVMAQKLNAIDDALKGRL